MMRRLAAMATMAALGVVSVACGSKAGAPAGAGAAPVQARVAKAAAVTVPRTVELYGTVEAGRSVAVSSRVMAAVTAVLVKAGDRVKAGQVLVEIDPQTARGQEAQARGALAQAQAALAVAGRNHERFKALAEKGAASELELDLARMQHEQAQGAVQQAQGAVEAASSVARESRVVAPFAGRVVARMVEVGDLAAPGRPLVMLESEQGRRLVVAAPESPVLAGGLGIGSELPVTLEALGPNRLLTGKVVEMTPGADPAAHTFLVKLDLGDVEIASGTTGRARLATGERSSVEVPKAAALAVGGLSMVVVRDPQGLARSRAVTLGETLPGDRIEVLSGLRGDEEVLVGLAALPADGARVEEVQ
ncbi:MAG TPA: efflux RND transporter periplasmic adaptor subunit [Thermoanaerobaculaceae bacterium]|nr:efflux RND transporter periplasmic adaptor subunit [Thermoanaerobaculaceae bacterium]HRS17328.1 efflux RND transporter periplasmic adaptor subunit [Thermoanaerobaculaceae bacterium]